MADNRDELVQKAKLAQQAERYEDMAQLAKSIIELGVELSDEERDLVSAPYKHIVCYRRTSWRAISSVEQRSEGSEREQQMVKEYKEEVEKELRDICQEVLDLLDKFIFPNIKENDSMVFYLKMQGDYYRYLAEVASGDERMLVAERSRGAYQRAFDVDLDPFDPIRLGLALNFSVFIYEILGSSDDALSFAKEAYNEALREMNPTKKGYRESIPILRLLRENVYIWETVTAADQDTDEQEIVIIN